MKDNFENAIQEALELEEGDQINYSEKFRDRDDWDSLAHLSLIAVLDEQFDVEIEDDEFETLETFEDLYEAIKEKTEG